MSLLYDYQKLFRPQVIKRPNFNNKLDFKNVGFLGVTSVINESWDYEDDFSTDKMTYAGSGFTYNASNDNQDVTVPNTLGSPQSYVDMLATTVSDTLWELRVLLDINSFTANTVGTIKHNFIGLFSSTSDMTAGQDAMYINYGSFNSAGNFHIGNTDGGAPNVNLGDILTTALSVTEFYLAVLRQSATLQKVSISSTSNYTEDVETKTKAVASTTQSLRYHQHSNRSGSVNGTISGIYDNVKFADAVNYL